MYTHTHIHTHTHTRTHITYTHLHTHREMEGYESELFLSYFAKGGVCPGDIEILQGGNASGFRCVCVCMCVRESVCIAWEGHIYIHTYIHICTYTSRFRVATMSRLLKITGLFCKRALQKRLYSAKEAYNFKEPTNRSHPISGFYRAITRLASGACVRVRVCMCVYVCLCVCTMVCGRGIYMCT